MGGRPVTPGIGSVEWWVGPGGLVSVVMFALAGVALSYLRYDATLGDEVRAVLKREQTIRGFINEARGCPLCSLYWFTAPELVVLGPLAWLATNGLFLLVFKNVEFLEPIPEEVPETLVDNLDGTLTHTAADGTQTTIPADPNP